MGPQSRIRVLHGTHCEDMQGREQLVPQRACNLHNRQELPGGRQLGRENTIMIKWVCIASFSLKDGGNLRASWWR